ncbi:MAG TPA: O-antigen ligase family protein [bacterium]|nr:O-antigen ligase family protein [bacterium]HPP29683.1 O-antigen ligase family protein [bacterium]
MKKKIKQQEREKINPWQGFVIISISVFVFLRFFVDGLSYPGFNFFWNIYFFLLTILHILIKKNGFDNTDILLLFYFVISTVSTGISPVKGTGITFNTQILAYWCIFFLIKKNFITKEQKKVIFITIIISGLLVSIYGLYQYFVGFEETRQFIYSRPELLKTLPPTFIERIMSNRVFATFVYPNVFAAFLLFLIPLSYFYAFSKENTILKWAAILTVILAFWNMFLTNSSGGIYILLFILQIMLLFLIFDERKLKIILPVIIILEIAIMYGGYITEKLPKMLSFIDRVRYWNSAIAIFKEHPVSGVGAENYRYYYTKYKLPETMEAKHPHSILFASLAETGLTGTFSLFAFLITITVTLFRKARASPLEAGLAFSFLAFFLHNLIDFDFINPAVAILFFITGGIALNGQENNREINQYSLTRWLNFLIIFIIILTGINYIRYSLSQKAINMSGRERDINSKLYYIERASTLYPLNFEIYEKKGDIFYTIFTVKEDPVYREQAKIAYQQAIALNPLLTGVYRNLAFLYEGSGDHKSAEKMYLKLLEIYPNKKQFNVEVAMFYKRIGNEASFNHYYERSKKLVAVTMEENLIVQEYIKWIESQK